VLERNRVNIYKRQTMGLLPYWASGCSLIDF
jgi:hypothetical protein